MLSKSNKNNLFIDERIFNKLPNMIQVGIDKWTKGMLSIASVLTSTIDSVILSVQET